MRKLVISVDFDGVIVTNNYPKVGRLLNGAKETIDKWINQGHTVVINTCRGGEYETSARDFLYVNEVKYHYFNENADELIVQYGTDVRKISADIYFDDKSMGNFCGWKLADAYVTWMANRKPVIFCIIGESGTGKTTLAEYIESEYGIPMIESYTTRPKRTPDEKGHTFISEAEFERLNEENMIAFTEFGGHSYCCLHSDVKAENTYVIDERGLVYLQENFSSKYDIKTIRCYCADAERIERAGAERVARDAGKFTINRRSFDFVWETDSWRDSEYYAAKKLETLHKFIITNTNRGWQ
jgi:guanylate kinase